MLKHPDETFDIFRKKLTDRESVYGLVLQNPVGAMAEATALAGYDFAWIDMEHTPMTWQDVERLIVALERHGCIPLVRVRENAPNPIGLAFDLGARIVCIPHVDKPEDARAAVYGAKYYPPGRRGYSTVSRSTLYGTIKLGIEGMAVKNENTMLMVQIESEEAVRNVATIASTEGVECLFVGYADLSQDLGISPDPFNPKCLAAIETVGAALKDSGRIGSIPASSPEHIKRWQELGFSMFICGLDTALFRNAAAETLAKLRGND